MGNAHRMAAVRHDADIDRELDRAQAPLFELRATHRSIGVDEQPVRSSGSVRYEELVHLPQ